jgi:UDP:flavonoid glycosyltransferase YjiC (YdhE family)
MDAVVSHGGHNTVCETLAHGIPLVVAPIRDDQPIVAQRVAEAGAGTRFKFGRDRAADIQAASTEVLDNPDYRMAAERLRASFGSAGGSNAAAAALETLLARTAAGCGPTVSDT